jgi:hypothetical protein
LWIEQSRVGDKSEVVKMKFVWRTINTFAYSGVDAAAKVCERLGLELTKQ